MKKLSQFIQEATPSLHTRLPVNEAISVSLMGQVEKLVASYFKKHLKTSLVRMPGIERYFNTQDMGFGVRFFLTKELNGFDCIRFNWKKANLNSASVASVDLFGRGKHRYHLDFEFGTSMVKILPFVRDFVQKPQKGNISYLAENIMINEALGSSAIEKIVAYAQESGETLVTKGRLYAIMKKEMPDERPSLAHKLFDELKDNHRQYIEQDGRREKMRIDDLMTIHDDLERALFTNVKVTSGSSKESYEVDPAVEAMEAKGIERLSFEQQIDDMKEAVRLLYRGVTNAVFIGGRGGIGKTHNVEEVLDEEMGLSDGEGYFKNAGSISAAGLYRLLYRHRDNLIMFDDSDNVFGDQEARNILKGATDTKPVRKLAWSKKSSDIVHPDDFDDSMEEEGMVPSFFEFTGKILFISNLKMDKLDPDGALRTRGIMMEINPTNEEVYDFMRKIAPKIPIAEGLDLSDAARTEVVDVLEGAPNRSPNLRTLVRALNIRAGASSNFDWKSFVIRYA